LGKHFFDALPEEKREEREEKSEEEKRRRKEKKKKKKREITPICMNQHLSKKEKRSSPTGQRAQQEPHRGRGKGWGGRRRRREAKQLKSLDQQHHEDT